jgi:hypothetical protein
MASGELLRLIRQELDRIHAEYVADGRGDDSTGRSPS